MDKIDKRIRILERKVDGFKYYPYRVLAVLLGLYTIWSACALKVTSDYPFSILWCSIVLIGFSFCSILWGLFGWQSEE